MDTGEIILNNYIYAIHYEYKGIINYRCKTAGCSAVMVCEKNKFTTMKKHSSRCRTSKSKRLKDQKNNILYEENNSENIKSSSLISSSHTINENNITDLDNLINKCDITDHKLEIKVLEENFKIKLKENEQLKEENTHLKNELKFAKKEFDYNKFIDSMEDNACSNIISSKCPNFNESSITENNIDNSGSINSYEKIFPLINSLHNVKYDINMTNYCNSDHENRTSTNNKHKNTSKDDNIKKENNSHQVKSPIKVDKKSELDEEINQSEVIDESYLPKYIYIILDYHLLKIHMNLIKMKDQKMR